jgi:hypothetical protein
MLTFLRTLFSGGSVLHAPSLMHSGLLCSSRLQRWQSHLCAVEVAVRLLHSVQRAGLTAWLLGRYTECSLALPAVASRALLRPAFAHIAACFDTAACAACIRLSAERFAAPEQVSLFVVCLRWLAACAARMHLDFGRSVRVFDLISERTHVLWRGLLARFCKCTHALRR